MKQRLTHQSLHPHHRLLILGIVVLTIVLYVAATARLLP
jgi:hypothetical protein